MMELRLWEVGNLIGVFGCESKKTRWYEEDATTIFKLGYINYYGELLMPI